MWTVWNEDRRCSPLAASVNQSLSLSACSAAQFNCADGGCTPLAARCDGWSDCYDEARYVCSIRIVQGRLKEKTRSGLASTRVC